MGQFAIVISGVGGHGCSRDIKDGESVLGCQRPDCPDCIAREMVRRFKRNSVTELAAELVHWPAAIEAMQEMLAIDFDPDPAKTTVKPHTAAKYAIVYPQGTSVIDNLVTGKRTGSF